MRMSQRIDRSQQQQAQHPGNDKLQYQDGSRDQQNPSPLGNHGDPLDKESPIVALEPEEPGLK